MSELGRFDWYAALDDYGRGNGASHNRAPNGYLAGTGQLPADGPDAVEGRTAYGQAAPGSAGEPQTGSAKPEWWRPGGWLPVRWLHGTGWPHSVGWLHGARWMHGAGRLHSVGRHRSQRNDGRPDAGASSRAASLTGSLPVGSLPGSGRR